MWGFSVCTYFAMQYLARVSSLQSKKGVSHLSEVDRASCFVLIVLFCVTLLVLLCVFLALLWFSL